MTDDDKVRRLDKDLSKALCSGFNGTLTFSRSPLVLQQFVSLFQLPMYPTDYFRSSLCRCAQPKGIIANTETSNAGFIAILRPHRKSTKPCSIKPL